jgi:hypothetical protein
MTLSNLTLQTREIFFLIKILFKIQIWHVKISFDKPARLHSQAVEGLLWLEIKINCRKVGGFCVCLSFFPCRSEKVAAESARLEI